MTQPLDQNESRRANGPGRPSAGRERSVDRGEGRRAWPARTLGLEQRELKPVFVAAACFFLLLFSYFIIRPIRDEMGVAGGIRNLKWLWLGTLCVMLAAHPVYAWLVGRVPRRRFVPLLYRFFGANLAVFFGLLMLAPPAWEMWIGRAFYVWTSVFNLFAVTVFWSLMSDGFTREQAKRVFGVLAVGGTLGALAGSAFTKWVAGTYAGPGTIHELHAWLMLGSVVLLEASAFCMVWLTRRFGMA
ncbi:MAG: MFS transporter, partial [Phycisphaerales bacterium]|nr:MFS transporter [Phycisphaerales bacterium]